MIVTVNVAARRNKGQIILIGLRFVNRDVKKVAPRFSRFLASLFGFLPLC